MGFIRRVRSARCRMIYVEQRQKILNECFEMFFEQMKTVKLITDDMNVYLISTLN